MGPLRVLLVEDQSVIRMLMTSFLAVHCTVAGFVERGDEVMDAVRELQPDVVVLDLCLPGKTGLQVLPELRKKYPHIGIVMLTSHDEPEYIDEAFRNGVDGYVVKRHALEQLWPAVRNARITRRGSAA